jgi:hypothetical protein
MGRIMAYKIKTIENEEESINVTVEDLDTKETQEFYYPLDAVKDGDDLKNQLDYALFCQNDAKNKKDAKLQLIEKVIGDTI